MKNEHVAMKWAMVVAVIAVIVCMANVPALAAFKATSSEGAQETFSVELQYWRPAASLAVKSGVVGSEIDVFDTLGMINYSIPAVNLKWAGKDGREWRIGYTAIKYDGNIFLSKAIVYGDTTFSLNANVISDLKINYFKLERKVPFRRNGDLAFLYGIRYFDYSAKLSDSITKDTVNTALAVPFPALGLAYQTSLGKKTSFYAEAGGIYVGSYGYFLDAEIGLKYHPSQNLAVTLGVRDLDIRYNSSSYIDMVDLRLFGPFFSMTYSF